VLVQSRTQPRDASCATAAAFGTRPLSDQLSDYRVDDPYIRDTSTDRVNVLDLDDSPTVLRDEAVSGRDRSEPLTDM
jgi:hypothetical protein